jgi:hypothetical protein
MPDWRAYVRQNLSPLRLDRQEVRDISEELAGHLEQLSEELVAGGFSKEEAVLRTCAMAGDWQELRQEVVSAKGERTMSQRVKQIWLPSLVTLFISWGILALLIGAGIQPLTWHVNKPPAVILYTPWLVLLPLIGAAGGYLSRRAQARGWRVYLAGTFPALAIGCVFLIVLPFRLIVDPYVVHDFEFAGMAAMALSWVLLPGVALCIGVALEGMWKLPSATEKSRQTLATRSG